MADSPRLSGGSSFAVKWLEMSLTLISSLNFRQIKETTMFKKLLSLTLAVLVINLACAASVSANPLTTKEPQFVEKVKAGVAKLGTGQDAHIEVKLQDGTKLKGYISEANDDGFVLMNAKTNAAVPVAYPQVKQVKGNNLSQGVVLLIGIGALILLGFIVAKTIKT